MVLKPFSLFFLPRPAWPEERRAFTMPDPLCKRKQGSPALRRLQGEQPQARPTAFHETRITRHESRLLCFSSHDFPAFPAILRVPPSPGAGVRAPAAVPASAVRWKSRKSAQNPVCSGQNGKPRSPGSRRLRAASAAVKAEGTHAEEADVVYCTDRERSLLR